MELEMLKHVIGPTGGLFALGIGLGFAVGAQWMQRYVVKSVLSQLDEAKAEMVTIRDDAKTQIERIRTEAHQQLQEARKEVASWRKESEFWRGVALGVQKREA